MKRSWPMFLMETKKVILIEDFIMRDFIEYASIFLHVGTDMEELESHLSMNGYDFGIDKRRHLLFVFIEELAYVETILEDRNIYYGVKEY